MVGRIQAEIKHLFIIIFLLYLVGGCVPQPKTTDFFCYKTNSIKAGDIILRKSYGMISDIIVKQLNDGTNTSHCGIISTDSTGNFYVIHSLAQMVSDADGMQTCSLTQFMTDSRIETVKVFRFRLGDGKFIEQKALYYLKEKIPFDNEFDMNDSTKFNCIELPIHILKTAFGKDISKTNVKPDFSIFQNSGYFDEISFVQKKLSK